MADRSSLPIFESKGLQLNTGKDLIRQFLSSRNCYDALPVSSKMIVFDVNFPLNVALFALVEHNMEVAPVWDSNSREFVALFTVTDYIDLIRFYQQNQMTMQDLSNVTLGQIIFDPSPKFVLNYSDFDGLSVETDLLQLCNRVCRGQRTFVPVVNPLEPCVLSIMGSFHIVRYLVENFREDSSFFQSQIIDIGIGTFGSIKKLTLDMTVNTALETLEDSNITAAPIVDEDEKIIGVYYHANVTFIASVTNTEETMTNLNKTLREILQIEQYHRKKQIQLEKEQQQQDQNQQMQTDQSPIPPFQLGGILEKDIQNNKNLDEITDLLPSFATCFASDSLQQIFESFSQNKFERIFCIDQNSRVIGVVTVKDLITYFTLN